MRILDYILPSRCPICLDCLPPGKRKICAPCEKKVRLVTEPTCFRCGKPIADERKEYCADCEKSRPLFLQGFAWAEYTSKYIRRLMAEVKYKENAQVLDYPCEDFCRRKKEQILNWEAEALIPVPVHPKKERIRGYNQAAEIARRLSRHLSIPCDEDFLYRKRFTTAQKELNREERSVNLLSAFQVESRKTYKKVILVDDIYTTGATVNGCARALRESGICEIYVLVLAIGSER